LKVHIFRRSYAGYGLHKCAIINPVVRRGCKYPSYPNRVFFGKKGLFEQQLFGQQIQRLLFLALPGGNYNGGFNNLGNNANWWSATENDASNAWNRNLNYNNSQVNRNNNNKTNGFSLRCVRDLLIREVPGGHFPFLKTVFNV
jgi:hypothetical protein